MIKKLIVIWGLVTLIGLAGLALQARIDAYEFDDEVMEWALGEEWGSLPVRMIDDTWNRLHGDLWYCSGTEVPTEAFRTMEDIYYGRITKVGDLDTSPREVTTTGEFIKIMGAYH